VDGLFYIITSPAYLTMSGQDDMLKAVRIIIKLMHRRLINFIKLHINLDNAEATFGKDSAQYMDVLEIVEMYASTLRAEQSDTSTQQSSDRLTQSQRAQPQTLTNLVFRPKP
jgi:hypothetical protein